MSRVKQYAIAAGTFGVALGVGFVMQNGDALASRFSNEEAAPVVADTVAPDVAPIVASQVAEADPQAISPEMMAPVAEQNLTAMVALPEMGAAPTPSEAPVELAAVETEMTSDIVTDAATPDPLMAADCTIDMSSAAADAAMVSLSITAPCHTDSPFVIHHQGMMFSAMTDSTGAAELYVPALAEVAVFIAAFPDGEGNVVTETVANFSDYDRAVLQWQGDSAVMLSAYEFGADFGEAGHVSRENMLTPDQAISGDGGFLVTLGDPKVEDALMAEVYTFPSGLNSGDGDVILTAEAEITETNCGSDLAAQSIQVSPDGNSTALDLTMLMPECDAVGDILILQNMFEDLTLASR